MWIFMRTFTSKIINLEMKPNDTIETVKVMIQDVDGNSPNQQKLMFAGKGWKIAVPYLS